jgi:hypothetical protein
MTITTIPKIKYLTNKDLLKEIHLSKNTYCTFLQPEYSDYDLIIPNLEKINIRTVAEAKRNRATKLSKKAHEAAVIAGGKKLSAKDFEIDYKKIYGAIGGSQDINVKITSALPANGVTIDVKVTKDADNATVFNKSFSSPTVSYAININSLSPGVLSTVTVVVTSKTKDTNKATKTFKIAAKS